MEMGIGKNPDPNDFFLGKLMRFKFIKASCLHCEKKYQFTGKQTKAA